MGFTDEVTVSRLYRSVQYSTVQYRSAGCTLYRDLRLWSIGGGADEVMLGIICKLTDMLPQNQKK